MSDIRSGNSGFRGVETVHRDLYVNDWSRGEQRRTGQVEAIDSYYQAWFDQNVEWPDNSYHGHTEWHSAADCPFRDGVIEMVDMTEELLGPRQ